MFTLFGEYFINFIVCLKIYNLVVDFFYYFFVQNDKIFSFFKNRTKLFLKVNIFF